MAAFPILDRIRAGERKEVVAAFVTVLSVLVAHALLETARDALFLANIPATRLPWMYLVLAAAGVGVAQAGSRLSNNPEPRRALIVAQLAAAGGTAVLWTFTEMPGTAVYYALYLWAGIASMSILVRFWGYLGERFTATQAKRLFPIVGAGASAGVLLGYSLADLMTRTTEARSLLLASAGFFAFSCLVPALVLGDREKTAGEMPDSRHDLAESLTTAMRNPYVRRVAAVLLLGSLTVTLVDFAFKSTVAAVVPAADLGSFFARAYLAMNVVSLLVLLLAVTPITRRIGVTGTLAILPAALAVAGVGFFLTGGLVAALLLKGADGALRWSTHKTATELLYVPMSRELRAVTKGFVDVVTLRGGQAMGSAIILLVLAVMADTRVFGILAAVSATGWFLMAWSAREPYLDLFRDALSRRAVETRLEFPDLDIGSLETLVAGLNSPDDGKAIAAIDLLERKDKGHLVPGLILYHPSPPVLVRALDHFAQSRRADIEPFLPVLIEHEYAEVRAAALRTSFALQPAPDVFEQALAHHCPVVNVTAIVGLAAGGWKPVEEALPELLMHVEKNSELARPMIGRALRYRPMRELAPVLKKLAKAPDLESRREAVHAMRAAGDAQFIETLIELLRDRELREDVRESLVELGEPALDALEAALCANETPFSLRVHLPRTVVRFEGQRAASILLDHLASEPRGMSRYKSLRALGRLVANDAGIELDSAVLDEIITGTIESSFRALRWRTAIERHAAERPELRTPGNELLVQLLRDKERLSTERLFRTLGLRYRDEDLAHIYYGLRSDNPNLRSSSRELLESALPGPLGAAVIALTDDLSDADRLRSAADPLSTPPGSFEDLLNVLIREPSATLSAVASYYANETGTAGVGLPADRGESEEFEAIERWLSAAKGEDGVAAEEVPAS